MAEVVILLAVKKIGIALGNEAINQAISQFKKFITQLTELQGSMGRTRRELRLMHEFLCRMDVRNRNNQAYEVWVEEVRMLVHGIQDIVDEYLHLVGRKHGTGWGTYLKKGIKRPNVLLSLNRIAASVKEAEVNLVHLFHAKDRWVSMASGGSSSDNSSYIVERSQHLSSISRSLGEEDFVGVENNQRTLVQWLEGDELERSVITLHGMGVLGKTAMAANVYRMVREKFECHAWVSISQTNSTKDVLKCLMDELIKDRKNSPSNIDKMDTKGLQDEVKGFLKDKKYLIVLDNVWAPETVNDLFGALVQNVKGSRIFVTTRIDDVAHLAFQDRRITLEPLSENRDLVGVDDDREKLMQWLEDGRLERKVIVLHGMGGLGKTALAANVYKKARGKFECHAWVSISQTYSREDVMRNLIEELFKDKMDVPTDIATMGATRLEETLKSFLEHKKYLIILDDVWTPEAFSESYVPLVHNDKGSRLVITTREGDVAKLASKGHVLTLKTLPTDKSWELFCKKAFLRDTDHGCPAELKYLSEEIVAKCDGLPLAIVSIGSLLFVRDKTVQEWRRINDQLNWEINNNPRLDHVRNVLLLSYIYLPTYLKSCFLYCSLFPEDYLLKRNRLIRFWIAEGFIEKKGESTPEEVAEGYLNELVHRNMLQLIERNSFGRIKSLRMHDIVRDLAVDLCQRECFGVAYQEDKYGGESLEEKDGRRLVIHKLRSDIQQSISSIHHLRSVITLDSGIPSSTLLSLVSKNSRYMSVLELSGLPIETVPDAIGDLFNLRHLGLRNSKVRLLPKSIEKLSNLLTLDLWRSDIQELPRGIVKLKKLRHLFAEKISDLFGRDFLWGSGVCIPKGLANLIDLQTLLSLEAQDESVGALGDLRQLRSIRIWNVKRVFCERLCASLVQMQFLSFLELAASDENEVLELNHLDPLPTNLQKLGLRGQFAEGTFGESPLFQAAGHNLYSLYLDWSQLREDPLPCLSRLSSLTNLELTRAYSGEQLVFLAGWFPKLKTLVLRDLPNLKQLEIHQGAMESLEELSLVNLSSMVEVPLGIEFLMPLKYLCFDEITPEFLTLLHECLRIGGMRWWWSLRDENLIQGEGHMEYSCCSCFFKARDFLFCLMNKGNQMFWSFQTSATCVIKAFLTCFSC